MLTIGLSGYFWYQHTTNKIRALSDALRASNEIVAAQQQNLEDMKSDFLKQQELNIQFNKQINQLRADTSRQIMAIQKRDLQAEAKKDPSELGDKLTRETNQHFKDLSDLTK